MKGSIKNSNSDEELERFKTTINLYDFALNNGYIPYEEKDGKQWRTCQLEGGDEVIVIRKDINGHFLYLNSDDDTDTGSIIDFVMKKLNLGFGHARKYIRQYSGEVAQNNTLKKETAPNYEEIAKEIKKNLIPLSDRTYLHKRKISDQTLSNQAFINKIFNHVVLHKGIKLINTAFPLTNETHLIGIEQKNKYNEIKYKNVTGLRSNGLWVSRNTIGDKDNILDIIIICESGEKSLAYHQLYFKENTNCIYISTAGSVTDNQISLLQKVIDKRIPKNLVIGMDSDEAGVRFTCNIIGVINAPGNLEKQDLTFRVSLQNKGETCKLRVVSLDNGNKYYEEVKYWIESNKNSPTEFLLSKLSEDHAQFTILFDNKRSPLDKIIKMILHFKKTDFFKIHLPIKKDFNEDLESLC